MFIFDYWVWVMINVWFLPYTLVTTIEEPKNLCKPK